MNKSGFEYQQTDMLLRKYASGDTTNDEEKRMREWFASHSADIPAEWLPYKTLFAYVAAEQEKGAGASCPTDTDLQHHPDDAAASAPEKAPERRHYIIRWLVPATAAASVLLALGIWLGGRQQSDYRVIVDGKEYADREMVFREANNALDLVAENGDAPFSALRMMGAGAEDECEHEE